MSYLTFQLGKEPQSESAPSGDRQSEGDAGLPQSDQSGRRGASQPVGGDDDERVWTLERQPRESAGEWVVISDQQANWYRGGEVLEVVPRSRLTTAEQRAEAREKLRDRERAKAEADRDRLRGRVLALESQGAVNVIAADRDRLQRECERLKTTLEQIRAHSAWSVSRERNMPLEDARKIECVARAALSSAER